MSDDPFASLSHQEFVEALDPKQWHETRLLHTPTLEAVLDESRLTLVLEGGVRVELGRPDIEALTRFLDQYAQVAPLPAPEEPFPNGWVPKLVWGPDGPVDRETDG